jgi:antitoxin MazE6
VSIPDEVFAQAERLARNTGKSRSRVFPKPSGRMVARHSAEEVTEATNRVCTEIGPQMDVFSATAARRVLEAPRGNLAGKGLASRPARACWIRPGFRKPVVVVLGRFVESKPNRKRRLRTPYQQPQMGGSSWQLLS